VTVAILPKRGTLAYAPLQIDAAEDFVAVSLGV
jgi:hypothetical protein